MLTRSKLTWNSPAVTISNEKKVNSVVQKRTNTKKFALGGKTPENPVSGTVLDHTINKRD